MESISEVNFPQNESNSSIIPLNLVIDNRGSSAAVDDLHYSVAWVAVFCCSRFFSNFAFCSKISLSNSVSYSLDCGLNSICCLVSLLVGFFDFSTPCFYRVLSLSICELLFSTAYVSVSSALTILAIDDWWRSKLYRSRFSTISSVWLYLKQSIFTLIFTSPSYLLESDS